MLGNGLEEIIKGVGVNLTSERGVLNLHLQMGLEQGRKDFQ